MCVVCSNHSLDRMNGRKAQGAFPPEKFGAAAPNLKSSAWIPVAFVSKDSRCDFIIRKHINGGFTGPARKKACSQIPPRLARSKMEKRARSGDFFRYHTELSSF